MGFGFIEYKKPEQAQKALKQLQVRRGFWVTMVRPGPKKDRESEGLSDPLWSL